MKSITPAIVIGLATSGVAAAAAAVNKRKQLRGGKANQQHRALEGECVGVPNGEWRPTPGCHGAALCMNDEEFFLYPCNEEEGFLYDETMGGCAPAAEVICTVGWESIGLEVDSVGDGETGETGETGDGDSGAGDADTGDAGEGEGEDEGEEDAGDDTEGGETGNSDGVEEPGVEGAEDDGEDDGGDKEKRMCNTLQEKTYFKACKKTHCVGLRVDELEDCKSMCRLKECTYEDEDEDEDGKGEVEGEGN